MKLHVDSVTWPNLVVRAEGTATAIEVCQLTTHLEPWLATRMSLLVLWLDGSPPPCPWFDESAVRAMRAWLAARRDDLRDRRISLAFVSPHALKRKRLARRVYRLEMTHGIALDVFAHESAARAWLHTQATVGLRRSTG